MNHIKYIRSAWINSLAHQIPGGRLPVYDVVKNELQKLFDKILAKKCNPSIPRDRLQ